MWVVQNGSLPLVDACLQPTSLDDASAKTVLCDEVLTICRPSLTLFLYAYQRGFPYKVTLPFYLVDASASMLFYMLNF